MHASVKSKAAFAIASAIVGAGVVAPQAFGQPSNLAGTTVMTIVKWSGTDCVALRTAAGQTSLCDSAQQPSNEAFVEQGKEPGDLVGADPVMGEADWISCELYLNGSPTLHDVALAGDGSDVSCLTTLG